MIKPRQLSQISRARRHLRRAFASSRPLTRNFVHDEWSRPHFFAPWRPTPIYRPLCLSFRPPAPTDSQCRRGVGARHHLPAVQLWTYSNVVTHSLAGCPPACAARRQAIWRADRKRAGSVRAGRRGRRSLDRGVPVLGESPALATASPQKQSGAGFRAKLAFLFRRRRSVAKHHGAMRLEGKHTEQHARSASASSNSIAPRFCCARNQFARVSWVRVIARR